MIGRTRSPSWKASWCSTRPSRASKPTPKLQLLPARPALPVDGEARALGLGDLDRLQGGARRAGAARVVEVAAPRRAPAAAPRSMSWTTAPRRSGRRRRPRRRSGAPSSGRSGGPATNDSTRSSRRPSSPGRSNAPADSGQGRTRSRSVMPRRSHRRAASRGSALTISSTAMNSSSRIGGWPSRPGRARATESISLAGQRGDHGPRTSPVATSSSTARTRRSTGSPGRTPAPRPWPAPRAPSSANRMVGPSRSAASSRARAAADLVGGQPGQRVDGGGARAGAGGPIVGQKRHDVPRRSR